MGSIGPSGSLLDPELRKIGEVQVQARLQGWVWHPAWPLSRGEYEAWRPGGHVIRTCTLSELKDALDADREAWRCRQAAEWVAD